MSGLKPITSGTRRKFERPPIDELVIALYHLPITDMRAQHIGIYWQGVRDKYPLCRQQTPIINPQDLQQSFTLLGTTEGEASPLPRFWFFSTAHSNLVQVQRNAFILNWRRGGNNVYPHFETVEKDFWNELVGYNKFLQDTVHASVDVVQRCELTYINVIERSAFFDSPYTIKNVVPALSGFCDVQTDQRQLVGLNTVSVYRVRDDLFIEMTTKLGARTDTKEQVAVLEIKAFGTPTDLSLDGANAWYKAAHDAIYETFLANTSEQIQNEVWKPL